MLKIVTPKIGGITDSAGTHWPADEKVDGGPSVLFDAIAVVPGEESAQDLVGNPTAHDFLKDAFIHAKFIALAPEADRLVEAVALDGKLDAGCFWLDGAGAAETFVAACSKLRHWEREMSA